MVLDRIAFLVALVALASSLTACGTASREASDHLGRTSQALTHATCPSCSAVDLGGGKLKYAVRLPSGRKYVELFVRKNGIQNVAQNITNSTVNNGDGTTTYFWTVSGYAVNDRIEYRFYSYLASSPGVFTPGPQEQVWVSYTYGTAFDVPCRACSIAKLGGGTIQFAVKLLSGQKYVEVFVRKNGVQNIAQNITASGVANGDGTSTYFLNVGGYVNGDRIDYRFYSYLPSSPGVFTPGPQERAWATECVNFDQCHVGQLDTGTDKCVTPAMPNGMPCTDGNACTRGDTCQAGVCVSGPPAVCAPSDQCHAAGTCSPIEGCSNPVLANGTACDDGDGCTTGDACESGMCVGTATSADANPACLGTSQGLTYAPHQPRRLPNPPVENGCYVGTANGWLAMPCADDAWLRNEAIVPQVGLAGIVVPPASQNKVSLVYGQIETTVIHADSVWDCKTPTCAQRLEDDAFSVQLNSLGYGCTDTQGAAGTCLVQWTFIQRPHLAGGSAADICIWTWQWTNTKVGNPTCLSTTPTWPAKTRAGLRDFDFVNIAGYVFDDNAPTPKHKLGMVIQYSMVPVEGAPDTLPNAPNQIVGLYATTTDDVYLLQGHWFGLSGGIMGKGSSSHADFSNAEVMTRAAASNCPGDTSARGPTCPTQTPLPQSNLSFMDNVRTPSVRTTSETDNLTLVGTPILTYPNANLVVTEILSSTTSTNPATATCLPLWQNHVFIKDHDGDNGGRPSNSGGVPFWESPDIFIRPVDAPAPLPNDVSADFEATIGRQYNLYLRLNNDYGCMGAGNIRVLIAATDPNIGSPRWFPVTVGADIGNYLPVAGTVGARDRAIVGPFPWTPPPELTSGHKCLLAAVAAGDEVTPAFPLAAAYDSNQIAQRNLIVSDGPTCVYSVKNPSTGEASLLLGVSVYPAKSIAYSTIELVVHDVAGYDWFGIWNEQATRVGSSTLSVKKVNQTTVLTIGTSAIALDSVPMPANGSAQVEVQVTSTASGVGPDVALSASLKNTPADGVPSVLVENGGTCHYSRSTPPCPTDRTRCNDVCVDVNTDPYNCGSCGHVCVDQVCSDGTCVPDIH
jgi:hypothetical protein